MYRAVIYLAPDLRGFVAPRYFITTCSHTTHSAAVSLAEQIVSSLKGPLVATGFRIESHVPYIGWANADDEEETTPEEG